MPSRLNRSGTSGSALIMSVILMLLVGVMAGSLFVVHLLRNANTELWVGTFDASTGLLDPATSATVRLKTAPLGEDGKPLPGQNFYRDYPSDPEMQSDGEVPSEFPSVFFDENKNLVVDDNEFDQVARSANGNVSGLGYVVPKGEAFGGNSLSISDPVTVNGVVEGNPHPAFHVNYDERVKTLINLKDTKKVVLRRTLFVKLNPSIETR